MSAGETITVVTPILGRIQCAPGFAATTLYVTIVGEQPFAKQHNQKTSISVWCERLQWEHHLYSSSILT